MSSLSALSRTLAITLGGALIALSGVVSLPVQVVRAAAGADLAITKTTSAGLVPIDGEIDYTIRVTNVGSGTAWHVRIRDPNIDPELVIKEGTLRATKGSCSFSPTDNLRCLVNRLLQGESVTVRFTAIAPLQACPFVQNQARTFADNEPSENLDNNVTGKVRVDIEGCPPDNTPPTGSVTINNGAPSAWGPKVLLHLAATDDRTGPASIKLRISNSPELDSSGRLKHAVEQMLVSSRQWSLANPATGGTSTLGSKTVYVQYGDRAGNWSALFTDAIRMRADSANSCTDAKLRTPRALDVNYLEQLFPRLDVDFFKFRLASRATVRITLSSLPLDYRLSLFNKDCERIAVSGNTGTTTEVIERALSRGTYFVRVGAPPQLYSIEAYTLRIGKL